MNFQEGIAAALQQIRKRLSRLEARENESGIFGFPEPLVGGWVDFESDYLGFTMYLHRDFVMLDGLIKSGTIADATNIAYLPGGYKSIERLIVPSIANDALASFNFPHVGGRISLRSGSSIWYSLNGTRIPLRDWYQPALQNSWVVFGRDNATQGYCYDAFGVLTLKGFLANGTSNATIMTLPFGAAGLVKRRAYPTIAGDLFSRVDILADGTVIQATGTNTYCSLNGISTPIGNTWIVPTLAGAWVNFGTGYADAGYWKDATGVVHLDGLVKSGTINTTIFTLPPGYRPRQKVIRLGISNAAINRVEIRPDGTVVPVTGNNTWVSLCGMKFFAAQ